MPHCGTMGTPTVLREWWQCENADVGGCGSNEKRKTVHKVRAWRGSYSRVQSIRNAKIVSQAAVAVGQRVSNRQQLSAFGSQNNTPWGQTGDQQDSSTDQTTQNKGRGKTH